MKTFKSLIIIVLTIFLVTPVTLAQDEDSTNRLRNVGAFLATFVDPDNSSNYLADSITINQCKRRDLFLLHDLKDAIGNRMLDEYQTITNSDLEDLKTDYALLDSELTYVRNMVNLEEAPLRNRVISRANNNYTRAVSDEFDIWVERYQSRLGEDGEYQNCPNSWQSVVQKWEGLSDSIQEIKTEWDSFKETFQRDEDREPTGNIFTNSARTIREGAVSSYEETRDNFRGEVSELQDNLSAISLSQEENYVRAVELQLSAQGDRASLANILEEEDRLTAIPGILRELDIQADARQIEAMDNTVIELTAGFTDNLTVVLWDEVLKLNETITDTNTLMSQEQTGVTALARSIAAKQCRL